MRARNLCGFEIHMELFFVNEFKKKKKIPGWDLYNGGSVSQCALSR